MMIRGRARWAKILGAPQNGYKSTAEKNKEWSFEVEPDEDSLLALRQQGFEDRLKEKDGVITFKFKRKAYKVDGTAAKKIAVVDRKGQAWDQDTLIGNGSILNVKYNIRPWKDGDGQSADVLAVQVYELVPYEGGEQFPIDDDGDAPVKENEQW